MSKKTLQVVSFEECQYYLIDGKYVYEASSNDMRINSEYHERLFNKMGFKTEWIDGDDISDKMRAEINNNAAYPIDED